MKKDDDQVRRFHNRVIRFSHSYKQYQAYKFAERLEIKLTGQRMYKNYDSYRNSIHKRRKTGNI